MQFGRKRILFLLIGLATGLKIMYFCVHRALLTTVTGLKMLFLFVVHTLTSDTKDNLACSNGYGLKR